MNKKRTPTLFLRIPLFERKRRLQQESTTGTGRDERRKRTGRAAKIISKARHTLRRGGISRASPRAMREQTLLLRVIHECQRHLQWLGSLPNEVQVIHNEGGVYYKR
jgi:hypothetical protein